MTKQAQHWREEAKERSAQAAQDARAGRFADAGFAYETALFYADLAEREDYFLRHPEKRRRCC